MKVSWDDDIPNIWKFIKFMFQTANQLWPLWFSWLLASLISIFCVKKSHVLCCIHWHSTTRKRIGLETHQTWLCTNISGLTPVSREPLIAPLIHSRYVPSSQPVNQDIFHDSLGCLPYYPIKSITIPFDSHKVPLIPQNPMKIPWQSLQKKSKYQWLLQQKRHHSTARGTPAAGPRYPAMQEMPWFFSAMWWVCGVHNNAAWQENRGASTLSIHVIYTQ